MIYINEKLRISKFDEHNLKLEEYRKGVNPKTKEEVWSWKWCGFYGDLRSALISTLNKIMFDYADEDLTLREVLEKIDEAREQIENSIKGVRNGEQTRTAQNCVSVESVRRNKSV